jgi:nucleoside-diphosphate-sugar epimerase
MAVKIAVTGAAGFIGRRVAADLAQRGLSPALVYRPSTPASTSIRQHIVRLDLSAADDTVFDSMGKPDCLIHLAWEGLPNYRAPRHVEHELPSQFRMLKAMVEHGLDNLVVAGTCFEYGLQSGMLSESLPPRPVTAYGIAKNTLRSQLQALQSIRPFRLTWARLFYVYGDGQAVTSLFSQLKSAAERGEKSFDMSGGEQLRDYLPVEAAASSIVKLALGGRNHGIINVCSGQPISIRNLVERWIRQYGWSIEPNLGRHPYPDYEPMAFWGDVSKLRAAAS